MTTTPPVSKPRATISVRRGAALFQNAAIQSKAIALYGLYLEPTPESPIRRKCLSIPAPSYLTPAQRSDWKAFAHWLDGMAHYLSSQLGTTEEEL